MLHSVMWVCVTSTVHACSTVMALLCIPVSELVSFAFSTIPICPYFKEYMYYAGESSKVANYFAACPYSVSWTGPETHRKCT